MLSGISVTDSVMIYFGRKLCFQGLELFMGLSARLCVLLAGLKCLMGSEVIGQQENDLSKLKLLG